MVQAAVAGLKIGRRTLHRHCHGVAVDPAAGVASAGGALPGRRHFDCKATRRRGDSRGALPLQGVGVHVGEREDRRGSVPLAGAESGSRALLHAFAGGPGVGGTARSKREVAALPGGQGRGLVAVDGEAALGGRRRRCRRQAGPLLGVPLWLVLPAGDGDQLDRDAAMERVVGDRLRPRLAPPARVAAVGRDPVVGVQPTGGGVARADGLDHAVALAPGRRPERPAFGTGWLGLGHRGRRRKRQRQGKRRQGNRGRDASSCRA